MFASFPHAITTPLGNLTYPSIFFYSNDLCYNCSMTDEEKKALIWHWDPILERVYTRKQFEALEDETVRSRCNPISFYDWQQLRKNVPAGKHIGNDPETNMPTYIDDPAPTPEEELQQEKEEKQRFLESTNTETILYLQQLMTPMSLDPGEEQQPIMTEAEYAELNSKRLEYAERIKEINTILAG